MWRCSVASWWQTGCGLGPRFALILPTGHTPLGMYEALRAHAADGSLAAEEATLFQLDEYAGLGPEDERSYRAYLRRELAGIRFRAVRGLDGSAADPEVECARHQALLDEAPIDLVVLGIGRDGHVAFDEPGLACRSRRATGAPPRHHPRGRRRRTSEDWRRSRARRSPSVCGRCFSRGSSSCSSRERRRPGR